ncbi:MAG: DUF1549 domain-containing protein [Verrucomicrobiae bacterium]|nr:DUF1549 domain-containing protein [Verrucomicrobiae bacterium]
MFRRPSIVILLALCVPCAVIGAEARLVWSSRIQPLFDVQCVKCHGPIEQKGGLELDTPDAVLKGGDEGAVVVPGDPDKSRLYLNLAQGADPHMPPKKQLSDADRQAVREWITALVSAPEDGAGKGKSVRAFDSVSQAIDVLVSEGWQQRGVTPTPGVDDRTWCRRLYLDLAGRIPTLEESETFLQSVDPGKREALVDRLLGSEDYAVRMREVWDVLLMGRAKRDRQEDRRRDNGWWTFLETAFRTNRPWNEVVRDVLVARPAKTESQGASWFLYERRGEHQAIAQAVAPIIYGTRMDCAQCHDHPLAREIKQAHYWGLVTAFNRSKNVDGGSDVAESAVGGFVNFTNLKQESQPAVITLLNGRTVGESWPAGDQKEEDNDDKYVDPQAKVRVPKFSRREAFAEAATHDNPLLARAFVNRMWAVLMGRGIVHPPDEMNARNVPSHPELLDWLAQDFEAHGYDTRRVIRGIALSRAYALEPGDAPPDAFAAAAERPLAAEQVARSWRIGAGLTPEDPALRRAAAVVMPDPLSGANNATVQEAQFLAYSPALTAVLEEARNGAGARIAVMPEVPARVRETFAAAYGRPPDGDELAQAEEFLKERSSQPEEGVRDLLWALMTSAEFLTVP